MNNLHGHAEFLLTTISFLPCLHLLLQGSHASWKVLDFFGKISRPWKVLENGIGPGNFSWKSWNFLLGYDVGGGHNGVGADAKICVSAMHTSLARNWSTRLLSVLSYSLTERTSLLHSTSGYSDFVYLSRDGEVCGCANNRFNSLALSVLYSVRRTTRELLRYSRPSFCLHGHWIRIFVCSAELAVQSQRRRT